MVRIVGEQGIKNRLHAFRQAFPALPLGLRHADAKTGTFFLSS